jgi:hypothetical protein
MDASGHSFIEFGLSRHSQIRLSLLRFGLALVTMVHGHRRTQSVKLRADFIGHSGIADFN